jgi:hypothetical protein
MNMGIRRRITPAKKRWNRETHVLHWDYESLFGKSWRSGQGKLKKFDNFPRTEMFRTGSRKIPCVPLRSLCLLLLKKSLNRRLREQPFFPITVLRNLRAVRPTPDGLAMVGGLSRRPDRQLPG